MCMNLCRQMLRCLIVLVLCVEILVFSDGGKVGDIYYLHALYHTYLPFYIDSTLLNRSP